MLPKIRSEIERDFSSMPSRFYLIFGVCLYHTSHTHLKTQIKDGKKKSRAAPIGVSRLFFSFSFHY
jgi:hypothetical protein